MSWKLPVMPFFRPPLHLYYTGPYQLLRELTFLLYREGYLIEFLKKPEPKKPGQFSDGISFRVKRGWVDLQIDAAMESGQVVIIIESTALWLQKRTQQLHLDIVAHLRGHGLQELE